MPPGLAHEHNGVSLWSDHDGDFGQVQTIVLVYRMAGRARQPVFLQAYRAEDIG